jgi:transcription elongation GreA/GreB family factor
MQKLNDKVRHYCLQKVENRLLDYKKEYNALTDAANQETKSSMGDKYETGRSMAQQEVDKIGARIAEAKKMKNVLQGMPKSNIAQIGSGALVKTNVGLFYIAVSLGQVVIDQQKVMVISPASPMAQKMTNKREGDVFEVNGSKVQIEQILNN